MSSTILKRLSFCTALWLLAASAAAQQTPPPNPEARARAAEHFDRGLAFYNEGRFDAALAEFTRAYDLVPVPEALYNLARVYAALGRSVESAHSYERYLSEGGRSIAAARRREAQAALAEQQNRVGRLMVRANVAGATIAIDGVDVATTPLLDPIPLAAGAHNVEVRAPGREAVRSAVAIAGREDEVLEVSLRDSVVPRGTLRLTATLPEVRIAVDDQPVGITPLGTTLPLPAGRHAISATRAGYFTETRDVEIEAGGEAELHFEMRRDPNPPPSHVGRVRLRLPEAPYTLRVDGEQMLGLEIDLPAGAHTIVLEVSDRQPDEGTVRIPAAGALELVPPLAWTLEARRRRLEAADAQRALGGWLAGGGGAILAAFVGLLIWNETEIVFTDTRVEDVQRDYDACVLSGGSCADLARQGEQLAEDQYTQEILRGVTITGAVVGAALFTVGLGIVIGAPNENLVDASARSQATLRIGPGSLQLRGSF